MEQCAFATTRTVATERASRVLSVALTALAFAAEFWRIPFGTQQVRIN